MDWRHETVQLFRAALVLMGRSTNAGQIFSWVALQNRESG